MLDGGYTGVGQLGGTAISRQVTRRRRITSWRLLRRKDCSSWQSPTPMLLRRRCGFAGMTVLPAWGWRGGDAGSAVVYNSQPLPGLSINGLAGYLADRGGLYSGRARTVLP